MRLQNSVHEAHPWVIGTLAPDFRLLDVWALPAEGSRDEFDSLVDVMTSLDPADAGLASRTLFWLRLRIGGLFGWDDPSKPHQIPEAAEAMLSERLPPNLRGSADDTAPGDALPRMGAGFVPLYRTADEWAAEISNDTVHGVLHLAWADQGEGRYRGQMAIYVKPRGKLGDIYMKLIEPFRHLIVYPALMRQVGRAWEAR
jgi:hypothetical protein